MKRNVYLILITVITILCIIAGTGYHLVRFGLSVAEGLPSFSEFIEAISDWDDDGDDSDDNDDSDNGISTETISVVASTENTTANIEELKKQRDALITAQDSAKKEKTRALRNLELQQITTIEQQIAGYNDTILSLETNLASAKLQLEAINSADNETKESVAILTEKGNVAAEILNYEDKVKECETYLKSYDIQNDNFTSHRI